MRRLSAHQLVAIGLDGEEEDVECRVLGVAGSAAMLGGIGQIAGPVRERLAAGALGHLVFQYQGRLVALRGVAQMPASGEGRVVFAVVDDVQVPERRGGERVPMALAATVQPAAPDGGAFETVTADVSATGALLERRGHPIPPHFRLELFLRAGDAVSCSARLARETPTHYGVQFLEMPEKDRIRLGVVLLSRARVSRPGSPPGG